MSMITNQLLLQTDNTKTAASLFIFNLIIIVTIIRISSGILPDFTQSGVVFGLLILTAFPTAWFLSISDFLFVSLLLEIVIRDKFIYNQIKSIKSETYYKKIRDNLVAQLIFGISTIIIGILFIYYQSELIKSFIGISTFSGNFYIFGMIIVSVGLAMIIYSFIKSKSNTRIIFSLIIYRKVRNFPENETRNKIINSVERYLDKNHSDFMTEINSVLLIESINELNAYLEDMNQFLSLTKGDKFIPIGTFYENGAIEQKLRWSPHNIFEKSELKIILIPPTFPKSSIHLLNSPGLFSIFDILLEKNDHIKNKVMIISKLYLLILYIDEFIINYLIPSVQFHLEKLKNDSIVDQIRIDSEYSISVKNYDKLRDQESKELNLLLNSCANYLLSNKKYNCYYLSEINGITTSIFDEELLTFIEDLLSIKKSLREQLEKFNIKQSWIDNFFDQKERIDQLSYEIFLKDNKFKNTSDGDLTIDEDIKNSFEFFKKYRSYLISFLRDYCKDVKFQFEYLIKRISDISNIE